MALRVLLADESTTIKKVFQLSLQDYAVEVNSVSLGPEVLQVAKQFKPDIVFCDVLLQKKNGYEVCAELKSDNQIKSAPVILMWSGFMELDEDKLQAARADGHLEKPFDVQDLRRLINQFVPKTKSQKLGDYLNFPKLPEMINDSAPPPVTMSTLDNNGMVFNPSQTAELPPRGNIIAENVAKSVTAKWNMDSFEPMPPLPNHNEEFQEVPLPPPPKSEPLTELPHEEEDEEITQWTAKPLQKFQVAPDKGEEDDLSIILPDSVDEDILIPEVSTTRSNPSATFTKTPNQKSSPFAEKNQSPKGASVPNAAQVAFPDQAALEKIVREQAKVILESIAWKVVPDLANQIIERELGRLLSDSTPQSLE
ncbi:MAG: response regulator [Bdellovibrionales bacterium]|nr:response regulator [Bdellovibrionales bacterium]